MRTECAERDGEKSERARSEECEAFHVGADDGVDDRRGQAPAIGLGSSEGSSEEEGNSASRAAENTPRTTHAIPTNFGRKLRTTNSNMTTR